MDPSDHELWTPCWGGAQCAHTKHQAVPHRSQNILTWNEPPRTNPGPALDTSRTTPRVLHHPHNTQQALEPGLSSEFNHHGTQAGMGSCGKKTPKKTLSPQSCCLEHLDPHRQDLKTWLLFVHLGEAQGHIS